MTKKKLLGRSAIALASAAVIAGGAVALDVRMALAEEKSEVTEIGKRDNVSDVTGNNVNIDTDTKEESSTEDNNGLDNDYVYDIAWNGRNVIVVESHIRLQDSDLSLTTALDKALTHIKSMSDMDLKDETYIQIQLRTEYIDETDIRYGSTWPMREYLVRFDVGEGIYDVTMNAVTGEICEYTYWNLETVYSEEDARENKFYEDYTQATENECVKVALDFVKKEFGEDIKKISDACIHEYGTIDGMRYSIGVYVTLMNGDVVNVEVDYVDKNVYRYVINPIGYKEVYYDIEWNGRFVNVVENIKLEDSDLSLKTALEKALNHIKDMSGKDLRNAAYIQIVFDEEYIDESDIRYGNVLPRREYTVHIDVESGSSICDGYNVTMDAVTGEIYEYSYWNSEAAYSADCGPMDEFNEYYDQKTEAECAQIALDFVKKEFGEDIIGVSEPVTVMYGTEFGVRYSTVVYISLMNGDVISVEVDYSDKKVYRYAINPREIYWSPAGDDTTETDTNTEDCTDDDVLNPDTSCYIEWNGREVNFTESYIRLQDSDLDLATALDNALNHIKEMSGKDLSDASFIQIALENKYIDEDDATYENESSRREYTVRFDIRDGELVYEEYNVVMNAVTGEIYEYNHWDYETDDSEDSDTTNENCEQATEVDALCITFKCQ